MHGVVACTLGTRGFFLACDEEATRLPETAHEKPLAPRVSRLGKTAVNREKKSLRHVAMVAKFSDDNKLIKSLKSLFALIQTSPILFNLANLSGHKRENERQ